MLDTYPASRASFSFLGAASVKENDTLPKLCSFFEVAVTQELGRKKLVYCCISSCFTGFNVHALFFFAYDRRHTSEPRL